MKRTTIVLLVLGLVGLTATPVSASHLEKQRTDVLAFADLGDTGDARLWRTNNRVLTAAGAEGIPAGVYTMWWVVWNTPEGCATPFACGEADLFDPEGDTGLAIGYAGGDIVGANGRLRVVAHLREGRALDGFPYPEFGAIGVSLTETSLVDSKHAEIHLVLRSHEERIPGLIQSQLRTFNG
ncbi:MAG: hypothetical protein L0Z47_04690, partial [Actinobacteria bacterium]|nr:hypothetical protein [Actinomycetota bacterium]